MKLTIVSEETQNKELKTSMEDRDVYKTATSL